MALQQVRIHNSYRDFGGAAVSGRVIITPANAALDPDRDTTYVPGPMTFNVTGGELECTLLAGDAGEGIAYTVTEQLVTANATENVPPYTITMPAEEIPDGAVLELSARGPPPLGRRVLPPALPPPPAAAGPFGDGAGTFG